MNELTRYWSPQGEPLELLEWAEMFERRSLEDPSWWRVGHDRIGDVEISTVWCGIDMGFLRYGDPPPLIFESMVFGGGLDDEQRRYATWADAEVGHAELVELVRLELAVAAS